MPQQVGEDALQGLGCGPQVAVRLPHAQGEILSVNVVVDRRGVEPLTSAVQRRRSPN